MALVGFRMAAKRRVSKPSVGRGARGAEGEVVRLERLLGSSFRVHIRYLSLQYLLCYTVSFERALQKSASPTNAELK